MIRVAIGLLLLFTLAMPAHGQMVTATLTEVARLDRSEAQEDDSGIEVCLMTRRNVLVFRALGVWGSATLDNEGVGPTRELYEVEASNARTNWEPFVIRVVPGCFRLTVVHGWARVYRQDLAVAWD